jgi:hypothetical protein
MGPTIEDIISSLRSEGLLLHTLGADQAADSGHIQCPFHADNVGSLSIWVDEDGIWRWTCHAGCGTGTYLDAARRKGTASNLPLEVMRQLGRMRRGDRKTLVPVPGKGTLDLMLQGKTLDQGSLELLSKTRRVSAQVAEHYYLCRDSYYWLIPIFHPDKDEICAVKMHAIFPDQTPKSKWMPIGTVPAERPKHGIATLYPRPEWWTPMIRLFIMPGELKALRMISMGHQAVSPTSGESFSWPEREIKRIKGFRCTVVYDDDPAGIEFKDRTTQKLRNGGIPCQSITAGRQKLKEGN